MIQRFRQRTAIALIIATCAVTLQPREAKSQVQLLAPAACATGIGCVAIGIVFIGTVGYMVWQSRDTGKMQYDAIEDAEDHDLWGRYWVKEEWQCRKLAAGRSYKWEGGKCYIKD